MQWWVWVLAALVGVVGTLSLSPTWRSLIEAVLASLRSLNEQIAALREELATTRAALKEPQPVSASSEIVAGAIEHLRQSHDELPDKIAIAVQQAIPAAPALDLSPLTSGFAQTQQSLDSLVQSLQNQPKAEPPDIAGELAKSHDQLADKIASAVKQSIPEPKVVVVPSTPVPQAGQSAPIPPIEPKVIPIHHHHTKCPQCAFPHINQGQERCPSCGWVRGTDPHPANSDLHPVALKVAHLERGGSR